MARKNSNNGVTLAIRIPEEFIKEFKIRCIEYDVSMQAAGKMAIETWMAASSKDNLKPFHK